MAGIVFLLPGTTVETIADAVLARLVPATPAAGTVAERLNRLDAAVTTRATPADVTVQVYSEPVPEGRVS